MIAAEVSTAIALDHQPLSEWIDVYSCLDAELESVDVHEAFSNATCPVRRLMDEVWCLLSR